MTPEQALNILEQATAQINAPRAAHAQIVAALQVLKVLVPAPGVSIPQPQEQQPSH